MVKFNYMSSSKTTFTFPVAAWSYKFHPLIKYNFETSSIISSKQWIKVPNESAQSVILHRSSNRKPYSDFIVMCACQIYFKVCLNLPRSYLSQKSFCQNRSNHVLTNVYFWIWYCESYKSIYLVFQRSLRKLYWFIYFQLSNIQSSSFSYLYINRMFSKTTKTNGYCF